VNGLQSNMDAETDKTASDDDDDDDDTGAGKTSARRGRPTAAVINTVDDDSSEEEEDVVPLTEPRPAKVIAGEVIKQWQTKTRSKGFCRFVSFLSEILL